MILLNDNKSLNTQMCANDLNSLKIFNVYAFTDLGASLAKFRQVRDKKSRLPFAFRLNVFMSTQV